MKQSMLTLAALVLLALPLAGCGEEGPTLPTEVNQNQSTVVYVIISPTPSPSPGGGRCEPDTVLVTSSLGNTWNTNQESALGAEVTQVGQPLPADCAPVTVTFGLEAAPAPAADCELLGGAASPVLRCQSPGNAVVRASAGGVAGIGRYLIKGDGSGT